MPIRVTNQMMSHRMMQNLWASMRRLDRWNQQLSTGRRISMPSDDPSGTEAAMRLRTSIQAAEQYVRNVDDAISWLESTDSALHHATQLLQRARELIVQGANGTLPDESREAIAQEIEQLLDDLVNVANTKHGQRHLFAGQKTLTRPFEIVRSLPGNPNSPITSVEYRGTSYDPVNHPGLDVEIDAGITLRYNLHGDDVFQPAFNALTDALQHLRSGDTDGLSSTDLAKMDEAIDNLLRWRSEAGARTNRLELVRDRLQHNQVDLEKLATEIEGVDIAEVIMKLKMEENVYRAALSAGARILQPSLADFLR